MNNGQQPAFPEPFLNHPDLALSLKGGLTKREYFAAMALQGMLANPDATARTRERGGNPTYLFVIQSVEAADELLKQLES